MVKNILFIALGGSVGAVARYFTSVWFNTAFQAKGIFPYGTLAVNLIGCFIMGIVWEAGLVSTMAPATRMFIAVGFLGAFTTFSSFAIETNNLFTDGQYKDVLINILLNNVGCLVLVAAGIMLVKIIKGV
ncbi:MAG: fluoride efflux transporter CrcB [bacterium]